MQLSHNRRCYSFPAPICSAITCFETPSCVCIHVVLYNGMTYQIQFQHPKVRLLCTVATAAPVSPSSALNPTLNPTVNPTVNPCL